MKQLLLIGFVAVVALPAQGAVLQIDVPAHAQWCQTVVVPDVSAFESVEKRQAIFDQGEEPLIRCARLQEIPQIGVPFIEESTMDEATPTQARITFCAVVAADAPACDGVERQEVSATKALAAICASDKTDDCMTEIETALKAEPFSLDEDAIAKIQWRFSPATNENLSAIAIAEALTARTGRTVRQRTLTATFTSHVIVAAMLP